MIQSHFMKRNRKKPVSNLIHRTTCTLQMQDGMFHEIVFIWLIYWRDVHFPDRLTLPLKISKVLVTKFNELILFDTCKFRPHWTFYFAHALYAYMILNYQMCMLAPILLETSKMASTEVRYIAWHIIKIHYWSRLQNLKYVQIYLISRSTTYLDTTCS